MKNEIKPQDVAEYFIALANETGEALTNLKLQKLVYYSQAWYLANQKKPLFKGAFQAWVHGPVLPELYHLYKSNGASPIITKITFEKASAKFDKETKIFLEEVAKVYMPFGGYELEKMTHAEKPWLEARNGVAADENSEVIISEKTMMEYYAGQIQDKG